MYFFPGRDSKIHVFRLSDFDGDFSNESSARGRQDLKEHRLERTRGCHMYAVSRPGGSHLRMVSCLPFQQPALMHSGLLSLWTCPSSDIPGRTQHFTNWISFCP
jgi:hypothetical protein